MKTRAEKRRTRVDPHHFYYAVDKDHRCPDCGVREGEIHEHNCEFEECPFCGRRLSSCPCRYKLLGYDYQEKTWVQDSCTDCFDGHFEGHPTSGLPEEIYKHGLPPDEGAKFFRMLEEKGRVPYVFFPFFCGRCGRPRPPQFMDGDWEKYIPLSARGLILCVDCYRSIIALIEGKRTRKPVVVRLRADLDSKFGWSKAVVTVKKG